MVFSLASNSQFQYARERNLLSLARCGSTHRLLNLAAIAADDRLTAADKSPPFFQNSTLNRCLIVKHTVRPHERDLFPAERRIATKLIIPFESRNLKLGASTIFVRQTGYKDFLQQLCPADTDGGRRDAQILDQLDRLPSLDPFLLREAFDKAGYTVARAYLKIGDADIERMLSFVCDEIVELVSIAFADSTRVRAHSLATKLLSDHLTADFEPLRQILNLAPREFSEGMHCWRGFLYYKWRLTEIAGGLDMLFKDIETYPVSGETPLELRSELTQIRLRICQQIRVMLKKCAHTLKAYSQAFDKMVSGGGVGAFRGFLLQGPASFTALGEQLGIISHIHSFWGYRTSAWQRRMGAWDLTELLCEFSESLAIFGDADDNPLKVSA